MSDFTTQQLFILSWHLHGVGTTMQDGGMVEDQTGEEDDVKDGGGGGET